MVIQRGEIWWASLPAPTASEPGYRRPVLVVQSDDFNRSRIATVIAVVLTSNLKLAQAPGNLLLPRKATGLVKDSVANVSQVITIDRSFLTERVGALPPHLLEHDATSITRCQANQGRGIGSWAAFGFVFVEYLGWW